MLNISIGKSKYLFLLVFVFLTANVRLHAQQAGAKSKDYFAIESYYKVKWGHAAEFIDLWKKNHYPLLKKALENGDVISITATEPKFHSAEEIRWDFRVTVVFKNRKPRFPGRSARRI